MSNFLYLDELPKRVDNPNLTRIEEPKTESDPFNDVTITNTDTNYTFDWDEEFKDKSKKPKNFENELNILIDSFDITEIPSAEELGLPSI